MVALDFTRRSPSEMVNTTALFVAKKAWSNTPTTPIGTIDTELAVEVTVITGPRGGKRKNYKPGISSIQRVRTVPLAQLIILARANLTKQGRDTGTSRYNELTGNRWRLDKDDLKGGASVMAAFVQRLIKSRHSSIKFIQAGWIPAIAALEQLVPKYSKRASGRGPSSSLRNTIASDFGSVTPAVEGASFAMAIIENRIGMAGQNSTLDAKRNEALWRVGADALQRAIDEEYQQTLEFIWKQSQRHYFKPLERHGFVIDV